MGKNPGKAFADVYCDDCTMPIPEGDPVYFHNGDRLCEPCARADDIVCKCKKFKKSKYDQCYTCNNP